MNLFRKSTATVALVALVSGIFSTGVSAYSTAEVEAANYLAQAGVINNHTANPAGYNLDQNVLRQEIAAVARGVAGLDKKTTCDNVFSDVTATTPNTWACFSVEALADAGLIALNAEFRPEANITKAEAVGMMVKAAFDDEYTFDSSKGTSWQEQVVAFAAMNGVTPSFTNYDTPATRGFVFEAGAAALMAMEEEDEDDILSNLLDGLLNGGSTDEDEDTTSTDTDNGNDVVTTPVVTGGNVEVTLNPASPAAQTIPNKGLVNFGKFDVTAGSQDVAVNSISLKREGLSNRSDISRVYFEVNSKRVSSRASININEDAIVSFTPALVVKAGSTLSLDLVVELSTATNGATVGAEHRFAVTSMEASANVASNLPVRTNTMRVGSYTVELVDFVATEWSNEEVNVWDTNIILWEFELQTRGDRDNLFKSVTLRNNGSADLASTFADLAIYSDGKKVSSETVINGREVTFIVNSLIENGRTEKYEIKGSVVSTDRDDDTVQFELRNETDLNVVEVVTNFSAPVNTSKTMVIYSIKGGELLLTRDTEFTNTDTVSSSTNDVLLLASKVRVDESVTVEDLKINYTTTNTGLYQQYRDLKLVVDGRTISTYTPTTSDNVAGTSSFTFDGTFLLSSDSTIRVLWNLKNNVAANSIFEINNFRIFLDTTNSSISTVKDVRYVSNDERPSLTAANTFGINGTVQWIMVTVADATVLVTRNDGLDNETLVSGARDVTLFGFSMRANDVSDLRLTSLKPTLAVSGTWFSVSNITNVRLYEGNTLLSTRNDFDFTSLNVTIPRNGAKSFNIVADFDNSVSSGSTLSLGLTSATNVSVRNVESNQILSTINGASSTNFAFINEGTVLVKTNSNNRAASLVTPSTSELDVFSFEIEAKDDKLRLTDLYVTKTGSTLDLANAVRSASISVAGRTVEWAVVSSGTLYFSAGTASPIVIDKDQTVRVDVRVAFNDSSSRVATNFALELWADASVTLVNGVTSSTAGMRVISESTGQTIQNIASSVVSNTHKLARTKVLANMTSGTVWTQDFKLSADQNRRATISQVVVEITGDSASGSTAALELERNNEVISTGSLSSGSVTFNLSTNNVVSAWEEVTFTVDGLSGLNTSKDNKRFIRIVSITYNDDVTASTVTVDNSANRFNNVGVPSNEATFTY